jgi:regulatory protein
MDKNKFALDKAMQLCSKQEYCVADVKKKLIQWGLEAEKVDVFLKQLTNEGFINEGRYAVSFARDKLKFDKWGKIKITYMLRQKMVEENAIQNAINEIDEEVYLEILAKELHKKFINTKATSEYEVKGKLLRFAQSRGFETDLALKTINEIMKGIN